ncbi:MAG: hypothetical protein J6Y15_06370, partial [Bacteroidaceae bacterium]|nr:hypothetical protein [Bacteroidaceae bacterium]
MKKEYIKPCVIIDSLELMSFVLSGSDLSNAGDAGDDDPKETEARWRNDYAAGSKNGQRGYGSYGSRNTGWGSL